MLRKDINHIILICFISFIAIDIISASYIFTNTVRVEPPDWSISLDSEILASDFGDTGNVFVYGIDSYVYYHKTYNLQSSRYYSLDADVSQIVLSNKDFFLAASDEDNNVYLFSYGGGPTLGLLNKIHFEEDVTLGGFVVLGDASAEGWLLVYTADSIYLLNLDSPEPTFEMGFDSDITYSTISHFADNVMVGTLSGKLYDINTFSEELTWEYQCEAGITSISYSPFVRYAVAGDRDGNVYLLDMSSYTEAWRANLGSEIDETCIRLRAEEVMIRDSYGNMYVFDNEGNITKERANVSVCHMSFWGDYVSYVSDSTLSKSRVTRNVADWQYDLGSDVIGIYSDYGSNSMMVACDDSIHFFSEKTVFLLGSRFFWTVLLFAMLAQSSVIGYLIYKKKGYLFHVVKNKESMSFVMGIISGAIVITLLSRTLDIDVFTFLACIMSAGVSSWQYSRIEETFIGIFVGFASGLLTSASIGAAFGVYYWLTTSGSNIIDSILGTLLVGAVFGVFFSVAGIIVGFLINNYYETYGDN